MPIMRTYLSYAADPVIRCAASSGGFVKAFWKYCLENDVLDKVVITKTTKAKATVISTSSLENILSPRTNSVYQAADKSRIAVCKELDSGVRIGVTLLGCEVKQLRKLQDSRRLENVFPVIELLCNYEPTPLLTEEWCKRRDLDIDRISYLAYRGDGWPGTITIEELPHYRKTNFPLDDFWSNDYQKYGQKKCQTCTLTYSGSDIIVSDPWLMGDVGDGKTVICICEEAALKLVRDAAYTGYLVLEPLPREDYAKCMSVLCASKMTRGHKT